MNKFPLYLFFILISNILPAQIKSPSEFLGYGLGERFTPYYRVLGYYNYIASVSPNVKLRNYGKTYEGRDLILAAIGTEENLSRLESIRKNNLRLSGIISGEGSTKQPVIVWLSYNVHGNEAVSTEASMKTLYYLVNPANSNVGPWLKNTIILIDPCINPDGRERYVNFYNSVRNVIPDPLPFTREHLEPWPGGRTNHYYFDLNRDWAWQSQIETKQRIEVFNSWLPQIHVDFHEQSYNEPYYFAPAAEPFHQDITPWQREFQTLIGRNNAKYFDDKGWLYFTKERFDLLYPSYGDTYPTYNGSIGMTYEQGGSGRAGISVLNRQGDTLTLSDRIDHHFTTGLSTIEVASANAAKVVTEFHNYFLNSKSRPPGSYKTYIIKGDNTEKLRSLSQLLERNGIEFGYGVQTQARGYNYISGKKETFAVNPADLIINAYQPKSVLLKILFEPKTFVSDSVTYDITAWSLPYAYGIQTYALTESIKPLTKARREENLAGQEPRAPIAYAVNWNSVNDIKFLAELLRNNVKVRYSEVPFTTGGVNFNSGSLIILRTGNEVLRGGFDNLISAMATKYALNLQAIHSGFAEKGPDLGSGRIRLVRKPRIALIGGEETSAQAFGELWHYFEQEIGYPISVLDANDLSGLSLFEFNVIIVPDGNYAKALPADKLLNWTNAGGKLIVMEDAIMQLVGKKGFNITLKEDERKEGPTEIIPYADRERVSVRTNIPGAIFKLHLDNTHPLAFGYPDYYFTLKRNDKLYNYLGGGWNVGLLTKNSYVTGFVGNTTKKKLVEGLLFGVQETGDGSVVYLADDILFRGFWENGKLMFGNAVFLVP
ncbi:M14 metallopeptidase family protein [Desertivirga arenae]|uniref:M14 metallopeptidase family protein n=1 Tax=Desertivirga arenae TaxID=2810309 RepID=UPI001A95BF39|nr:M14 metallopeptidase family protein [Pedobacter sp. SYSU D00823]